MRLANFRNIRWACALAAFGVAAVLAAPSTVRIDAQAPAQQHWGSSASVKATFTFSGPPCPASFTTSPLKEGTVTVIRDGNVRRSVPASWEISADCNATTYTSTYLLASDQPLSFGRYLLQVEYSGGSGYGAAVSNPVAVEIVPEYVADGVLGSWKASHQGTGGAPGYTSSCTSASYGVDSGPPAPPPGVVLKPGALQFDLQECTFGCGWTCPPYVPPAPVALVHLEVPTAAAGRSVWIYAPGWGSAAPFWRPAEATISDGVATVAVSGNAGDRRIEGRLAFGTAPVATPQQDLWWGGAAESGWGFSLAQSGEQFFGALYVYRDNASPVWVMMPGGSWDATHRVFSGSLYTTMGSWFAQYDASRLQVGASIGTARITFAGDDAATLDYTIGGTTGRKAIQRYSPAASAVAGPRTGMWWAGNTQNGWGLFVQQKGSTTFAVWFTYDRNGSPTWYAMSDGAEDGFGPPGDGSSGPVRGTLFATTGGPWLGAAFNPAAVSTRKVGDLVLNFQQGGAGLMAYSVDGVNGSVPIYRFPF